ncbi:MAG: hypothetical protein KDE50_28445 [Caldilineaceae bacterium]|nr:hypothetical protein [Caldilineaceae bacterium]
MLQKTVVTIICLALFLGNTFQAHAQAYTNYLPFIANMPMAEPPPSDPQPPAEPRKLYVRDDDSLQLEPQLNGSTQHFVYHNYARNFSITLGGDIRGSTYEFGLVLASPSSTTFKAELKVGDQTIASDTFSVNSRTYTRYSSTVTGVDPQTKAGDILTLHVSIIAGREGGILSAAPPNDSYVAVPLVN